MKYCKFHKNKAYKNKPPLRTSCTFCGIYQGCDDNKLRVYCFNPKSECKKIMNEPKDEIPLIDAINTVTHCMTVIDDDDMHKAWQIVRNKIKNYKSIVDYAKLHGDTQIKAFIDQFDI